MTNLSMHMTDKNKMKLSFAMSILALLLAVVSLAALPAGEAEAAEYTDTHQTAPQPDRVIMPSDLVGTWSPNPDDPEAKYIEFYYDNGDLVYFYYSMTAGLFGSEPTEFEYNHGYVALKGNQGACDCYLTSGSKIYESFYVSNAPNGSLTRQDDGKTFRRVGNTKGWRSWLSWPTKPACYDSTTVATANGQTSLGPTSSSNGSSTYGSTSGSTYGSTSSSTNWSSNSCGSATVGDPYNTGSCGYVLPQSSTHFYTYDELMNLSNWGLYIARNEIAARHGYIFSNHDLRQYFGSKSWYCGTLTRDEFRSIPGILNTTEEANIDTILAIEKGRNSVYLPKD